jgi:glycosyltransferase involved in cell wall biosynthesis
MKIPSNKIAIDFFSSDYKKSEKFFNNIKAEKETAEVISNHSLESNIAILLCTYYGQNYLYDQLESFSNQTYKNWKIFASDDGSTDNTRLILEEYKKKWGSNRLSIKNGPEKGYAANFLSLSCDPLITANYYAYSDQDDIWEPKKIDRAIQKLKKVPDNIPALYCSRTQLVDSENQDIGLSPLFKKPITFANALMQNVGGGNTMIFNQAARELLQKAGADIKIISHDWWLYMVVSGCGGSVFYDTQPSVRYRQHANNLVGMNSSNAARLSRLRMLLKGRFRFWMEINITALQRLRSELTPENRIVLDCFTKARKLPLLPRLIGIRRSGIYRQTFTDNIALTVAAILKKL